MNYQLHETSAEMMKKKEAGEGCGSHCRRCCDKVRVFVTQVIAPSMVSYFLWSTVIYIAAAVVVIWATPRINDFLCAVDPHPDQGGMGCPNCPSTLLMCSKTDTCWTRALNITFKKDASSSAGALYQALTEAAVDTACNSLVQNANDAVDIVGDIGTSATPVTAGCKTFHCGVLLNALMGVPDLNAVTVNNCTNVWLTKPSSSANVCPCQAAPTYITPALKLTIDAVCGKDLLTQVCKWANSAYTWCPPLPSTTPQPSGAAARLLADLPWEYGDRQNRSGLLQEGVLSPHAVVESCSGESGGKKESLLQVSQEESEEEGRQLQGSTTPAASGAANSEKPAYTVSAWSTCSCYQQCMPGVQTRLVKCLAASCKDPMPPTSQTCVCTTCARCQIELFLQVLFLSLIIQGGICLLTFLAFLSQAGVTEDGLVKLSIMKRIAGFICKNLPPITRLATLVNLFIIIGMLVLTFGQLTGWQDCTAPLQLTVIAIVVAVLWALHILLAQYSKMASRIPPWLYIPVRQSSNAVLKYVGMLWRFLGP